MSGRGAQAADLHALYAHFLRADAAAVVMAGLDYDAIDVRADGALLRIEFASPASDAGAVHANLAELGRQCRA